MACAMMPRPPSLRLPNYGMLLPVSGNPNPPAGPALPFAFNPDRRCSRTRNPAAGYPYVICSSPTPITACPDILSSGRNGLRFNLNGRRRFCHDHFSTDHPVTLRSDDFLPDLRCRCGHNWLRLAAGEQKRRQTDKVKSSFHHVLLSNDSFADGELALSSKNLLADQVTEE
jgi:hypothetical protein